MDQRSSLCNTLLKLIARGVKGHTAVGLWGGHTTIAKGHTAVGLWGGHTTIAKGHTAVGR